MTKYLIGICDDERGTCAMLEEAVYRFFEDYRCGAEVETWASCEACLEALRDGVRPDVLFLDIEFPGINGVDGGQTIREELGNSRLQIVYISSKTGYALELFKVHPYDFLIKPISQEAVAEVLRQILSLDESDQQVFRYRVGHTEHAVPFGRIMYLESTNKHVVLHLADGTAESFFGKLSDEIPGLPGHFAVAAKSFAVNLKYVASCAGSAVTLTNGEQLGITAPNRDSFRRSFMKYAEKEDFGK